MNEKLGFLNKLPVEEKNARKIVKTLYGDGPMSLCIAEEIISVFCEGIKSNKYTPTGLAMQITNSLPTHLSPKPSVKVVQSNFINEVKQLSEERMQIYEIGYKYSKVKIEDLALELENILSCFYGKVGASKEESHAYILSDLLSLFSSSIIILSMKNVASKFLFLLEHTRQLENEKEKKRIVSIINENIKATKNGVYIKILSNVLCDLNINTRDLIAKNETVFLNKEANFDFLLEHIKKLYLCSFKTIVELLPKDFFDENRKPLQKFQYLSGTIKNIADEVGIAIDDLKQAVPDLFV